MERDELDEELAMMPSQAQFEVHAPQNDPAVFAPNSFAQSVDQPFDSTASYHLSLPLPQVPTAFVSPLSLEHQQQQHHQSHQIYHPQHHHGHDGHTAYHEWSNHPIPNQQFEYNPYSQYASQQTYPSSAPPAFQFYGPTYTITSGFPTPTSTTPPQFPTVAVPPPAQSQLLVQVPSARPSTAGSNHSARSHSRHSSAASTTMSAPSGRNNASAHTSDAQVQHTAALPSAPPTSTVLRLGASRGRQKAKAASVALTAPAPTMSTRPAASRRQSAKAAEAAAMEAETGQVNAMAIRTETIQPPFLHPLGPSSAHTYPSATALLDGTSSFSSPNPSSGPEEDDEDPTGIPAGIPVVAARFPLLSPPLGTSLQVNNYLILIPEQYSPPGTDIVPSAWEQYTCRLCRKTYSGKNARSVARRHLQDKHEVPLSVQERRSRWDRTEYEADRPKTEEGKANRNKAIKAEWARKNRLAERDRVALLIAQGLPKPVRNRGRKGKGKKRSKPSAPAPIHPPNGLQTQALSEREQLASPTTSEIDEALLAYADANQVETLHTSTQLQIDYPNPYLGATSAGYETAPLSALPPWSHQQGAHVIADDMDDAAFQALLATASSTEGEPMAAEEAFQIDEASATPAETPREVTPISPSPGKAEMMLLADRQQWVIPANWAEGWRPQILPAQGQGVQVEVSSGILVAGHTRESSAEGVIDANMVGTDLDPELDLDLEMDLSADIDAELLLNFHSTPAGPASPEKRSLRPVPFPLPSLPPRPQVGRRNTLGASSSTTALGSEALDSPYKSNSSAIPSSALSRDVTSSSAHLSTFNWGSALDTPISLRPRVGRSRSMMQPFASGRDGAGDKSLSIALGDPFVESPSSTALFGPTESGGRRSEGKNGEKVDVGGAGEAVSEGSEGSDGSPISSKLRRQPLRIIASNTHVKRVTLSSDPSPVKGIKFALADSPLKQSLSTANPSLASTTPSSLKTPFKTPLARRIRSTAATGSGSVTRSGRAQRTPHANLGASLFGRSHTATSMSTAKSARLDRSDWILSSPAMDGRAAELGLVGDYGYVPGETPMRGLVGGSETPR